MKQTPQNKNVFLDRLEIVLQRKWWLILALIIGTTITIGYSYSLPPLYRSSTLILVESQKIPTAYVSSTVTSSMQERLSTIRQQISSRTNLEKIITEFGLYGQEQKQADSFLLRFSRHLGSWTNFKLENLLTRFNLDGIKQHAPIEVLVDRMRSDIEVQVIGAGNAFTLSYIGNEPLTVKKVTNTLASLFIEQSLKIREQEVEGTSEFLESELSEARRRLQEQERALTEFKERNMGSLPEQVDVNLRTLDRVQLELQNINEALVNAEVRKISLERLRQEIEILDEALKNMGTQTVSTPSGTSSSPSSKLNSLKEELARLRTQFTDNYPDIVSLKRRIKEIEQQLDGAGTPPTSDGVSSSSFSPREGSEVHRMNLSMELMTLNSEIDLLKKRREKAVALIKQHEKRVEDTFTIQQSLMNLTRDYDMSQRSYQSLLDKRLNAKISENLEKRQKGEQFRIVDPANLPQEPFKPDRRKIILMGSLLSGGLGIGVIFLKEYLEPHYRKPEDFQEAINLPVLGTIPRKKFTQQKDNLLGTSQEPDSLIAEQYRLLYTRISQLGAGKPRPVFAISSAIKGEGKTVTALNLALVTARDFGKKVLLIDGDFKSPAISAYLKPKPQHGLEDFLLNKIDIQSIILTFGHNNLSVMPVLKNIVNPSGILSSQKTKDLIEKAKETYDLVIIDTPPILSLVDMNIWETMVDSIILVVRAESTPREVVVRAINSFPTEKLFGIVLNGTEQSILKQYTYYYNRA